MNLLLNTTIDVVLPIILIILIIASAVIIVYFLKRKFGEDRGMITKDMPKQVFVELKKCYLKPEEV